MSLASFSAGEALDIIRSAGLGARLLGGSGVRFSAVAVDSRAAASGSLFAALPGEKADGHDFLEAASENGAGVLLVSEEGWARKGIPVNTGKAVIIVNKVLSGLQALARGRRLACSKLLRIGITGSSGKTTTKEIAASILAQSHRVAMNPGNLNSDIGLSQSMFGIDSDAEIGVFEMGMNRAGEMAELAGIYEPDIALINNIGTAHIGILGSRDAIAFEKKQIFSRFSGSQKGLVPESDDYNAFLKEGVRGSVADFGPHSTRGFRGADDLGLDGFTVDWEGLKVHFPLVGRHNLSNAIAAMALAECVGTPPQDIAAGLESVRPLFGRSEILRGAVTIIRDCYNANPDSAEAAIEFCDSINWKGRRIYVLGSMLELGADSECAHRGVGAAAAKSKADALFFFGEETHAAFDEAKSAGFKGLAMFETDFDRLARAVKAFVREGDLLLIKASRGMALERLVDHVRE